jgi:hypothetical protein
MGAPPDNKKVAFVTIEIGTHQGTVNVVGKLLLSHDLGHSLLDLVVGVNAPTPTNAIQMHRGLRIRPVAIFENLLPVHRLGHPKESRAIGVWVEFVDVAVRQDPRVRGDIMQFLPSTSLRDEAIEDVIRDHRVLPLLVNDHQPVETQTRKQLEDGDKAVIDTQVGNFIRHIMLD